jgi:hypothetical protein
MKKEQRSLFSLKYNCFAEDGQGIQMRNSLNFTRIPAKSSVRVRTGDAAHILSREPRPSKPPFRPQFRPVRFRSHLCVLSVSSPWYIGILRGALLPRASPRFSRVLESSWSVLFGIGRYDGEGYVPGSPGPPGDLLGTSNACLRRRVNGAERRARRACR